MIGRAFHTWERRLASIDTNRIVRPFEWGLEWLGLDPSTPDPAESVTAWAAGVMTSTDQFYAAPPTSAYEFEGNRLRFPSALKSPYPENDAVTVRVFPARQRTPKQGHRRRAVIVLPQWNSDPGAHVGLCQLFAYFGLTALRLTMPYHETRRPAELERADYIVSPNIGRTLHANRQAVLDIRRTVDWLVAQGYDRIGVMGTSLGSCLAGLAMAHDPRIAVGAFNHISPFFADVVWQGISTRHVRAGLEGHVTLDTLRAIWLPISPFPFVERLRGRPILNLYALYDLTFPIGLSRGYLGELGRRDIPHARVVLPCGHYTSGKTPFKFLVGYHLTRFLTANL